MYKIIKDSVSIALTDSPTYIRLHTNGCFVLCKEHEAQGIAYNSTPYHLSGRSEMRGAETVVLAEADIGAELSGIQATIDDLTIATLMGGAPVV